MQIFVNSTYDFAKWRIRALILSLVVIAAGIFTYITKGLPLGIDFAGGANIILKFREQLPLQQLRSILPDATIQQYGPAAENSVLIRLPQKGVEGDYAGQVVDELTRRLNPESASKHDLNYLGSDRLASLMMQADPDSRGSNPAAVQHYDQLADRIIAKRSDIGIFTNMNQVTAVPGVTTGVAKVINERAFLGRFNLLNQETVGPQVGSELQRKAMWAIVLSSLAMAIYIAVRFEQGLVFGVAGLACIVHDVLIALSFLVMMRLEFSLNVVAALLTIVGYSINDNVVMYDRVRENRRKSKTQRSVGEHLNKAINDTLSRTVLTAGSVFLVLLALLIFGGEVIRDFAWILLIGVVSGTFSTLFVVPAVSIAWENWQNRNRPAAKVRVESVRNDVTARTRKAS
ncbi:MAG: protein translocase subunit SecF [Thermoanaerobaculia bacterium]|nr:protein translocase subunit SecF [Thermoanaerobaculia bacterium]